MASGCHRTPNISNYGMAWVTVTSEPGGASTVAASPADFTSYVVTIDSITLTRNDGVVVTALGTPEIVDLTQLKSIAEMWGTATIPTGTYVSATVTLDYTDAVISVMVNGVPTAVTTVVSPSGVAMTTLSETVNFDPANQLTVTPTYASTSAERLAINIDLAASGYVGITASPPGVVVNPFITAGVLPSDTKLIRIRGPLINSNVAIDTYTVYIRPFYDEVSNLGSLTLFNSPTTVYSINGAAYVGAAGINQLSLLSAGVTVTAAYATFVPLVDALNGAPAGKFYPVYVVGGSTLEDNYTEGISGQVIARTGDTLTLRSSTLFLNTADVFYYEVADTQVLLGAGTLVTADGVATLTGLNSDSIAVGQQVVVRGIYGILPSGEIQIDATGTSATNTGSVRLQSTQLWGSLVSLGAGSLTMNLQAINDWPASIYDFSGSGATAAQNPAPAAFDIATGSLTVPAGTVAGDPLWINGLMSAFGAAPPDFTAFAVNSESSVQVAGGTLTPAGTQSCGLGSEVCEPASMRVLYAYNTGTTTPFVGLSNAGFAVDLANPKLTTAVIRIGPEIIDMKTLPASPQVVPTTLPLTATFGPQYAIGNPTTSTVTPTVTTSTTSLQNYSSFPAFVTEYNSLVPSTGAVLQFDARGVYDRTTNIFTATSIDVVL